MIKRDWTIEDYVRESNMIEGIDRCDALECHVFETIWKKPVIEMADLANYVKTTQEGAILRSSPSAPNVRVGLHIAPKSGPEIYTRLEDIIECANSLELDSFKIHCQYETLHPFTDGNGRSGRLLWHWQMRRMYGERYMVRSFLHWFYYQTLAETGR